MTVPYTFANQTGAITLSELDANFAAVPNFANTAGTVTNTAQPNITSIGVLNSLSVTGNTVTNLIFQKAPIISLGANAGFGSGIDTISIGNAAGGNNDQGSYTIAIGSNAGFTGQNANSIAIGAFAGDAGQGESSIAIGFNAATNGQNGNAIAIGRNSGNVNQGGNAIAIGRTSGATNQGGNAIAIGRSAGNVGQGVEAISIGHNTGNVNQGNYAVAIGSFAANNNQGSNSVAIGSFAGYPSIANNAIAINGDTVPLDAPNPGLYIAPIRSNNSSNVVFYNTSTKELTYSTPYGDANVASYLANTPVYTNDLSVTGQIFVDWLDGNGAPLPGAGIVASTANIYDIGEAASPFANIYATNYFGNGSHLTGIVASGISGNLSTTGNITASYFIGNGSQLTGIVATGISGNLSTTGNITGNYFIGNGSQLSGIATATTRTTVTVATGNLAANAAANIIATGYKGYALYSIQSNNAAWVTLYTSNAAATSDYTRAANVNPTAGSGVIAESISNAAAIINFTPAVVGFNNENVPTVAIPMKIVNQGNANANISVTLTLLKMEG